MVGRLGSEVGRYKSQESIFSQESNRLAVLKSNKYFGENDPKDIIKVKVWRNHGFESVAEYANCFSAIAGVRYDFKVLEYDDTFFVPSGNDSDLNLLWVDFGRYSIDVPIADFFIRKIDEISGRSPGHILIVGLRGDSEHTNVLSEYCRTSDFASFYSLDSYLKSHDLKYLDEKRHLASGTALSSKSILKSARKLACHWLYASCKQPIKAIAFDLDNTLYTGVLGEDGIEGLKLDDCQRELQEFAVECSKKGLLVNVVSKNEDKDVRDLFETRSDFPLKKEHITYIKASWRPKAVAISELIADLRIAADSVLFVDDNVGELLSVVKEIPTLQTLHANPNTEIALNSVVYYPGVWRSKAIAEDALRSKDLKANAQRTEAINSASTISDYYRSLAVSLLFEVDEVRNLERYFSLSNKTNQFNSNFCRYKKSEIDSLIKSSTSCVVSVGLSDVLSESGIISLMVAKEQGEELMIEEICISCRSLGRQLEESIFKLSIVRAIERLNFNGKSVAIPFRKGPRNSPMRVFLDKISTRESTGEIETSDVFSINLAEVCRFTPDSQLIIK